jgi:hypothetical protein
MVKINEIPPFQGKRLIKENEHVAIWEEVFEPGKPTPPHRHMRDYIAIALNAGDLTITPLAGEPEEYTPIAGEASAVPTEQGAIRLSFGAGTIAYSRVPADGHGHVAVQEGPEPSRAILIEIKGTATEAKRK